MITPILGGTLPDSESDSTKVATYNEYITTVLEPAVEDLQSPPAARVYNNANQSISNNTLTALAFNSERFDTDAIHDNSTNNSRLTCKTAGKYLISISLAWAANATGLRYLEIDLNGATPIAFDCRASAGAGQATGITISFIYNLAINDYIEAKVLQDSGGALNVLTGGNYSPEFSMIKIG